MRPGHSWILLYFSESDPSCGSTDAPSHVASGVLRNVLQLAVKPKERSSSSQIAGSLPEPIVRDLPPIMIGYKVSYNDNNTIKHSNDA